MCKEFSRIVCVSLFSYQGYLSCDSSFTLSHSTELVKNFFQVFQVFFNPQNSKRRRRDLNPRAAINDLLPFQGSPFGQLGYFSKLPYNTFHSRFYLSAVRKLCYYIALFLFCQALFSSFFILLFLLGKRREWDSNPRALADKRFSRPPRYDHFDISPYLLLRCLPAQEVFYH